MPTADLELTVSSGGTKSGKEDPSLPCREGGKFGSIFAKAPELYAPHKDKMTGGTDE